MKESALLPLVVAIIVSGCALTPHQQLAKTCAKEGHTGKAYDDCVAKSIAEYDRDIALAHEQAKKAEAKVTLESNKAQCTNLGFKSGTNGFAACMLKAQELRQQQNARSHSMQKLKELVKSCNMSRALDTGSDSEANQWNRFSSADVCSNAQVQAMELGMDPSKLIAPIPVAKKPTQITCNTFGSTTTCTDW